MSKVALILGLLLTWTSASALPLYTSRSGRTCDNCHSLPNTWFDPSDAFDRKCTLSCVSCHVDPNGGGLRNASGRYYSQSTLPIFLSSRRPLQDQSRHLIAAWAQKVSQAELASSQPTSGPLTPEKSAKDPRGPNAPPAEDGPVWGTPSGYGTAHMAWLDGRYGELDADPLVTVGMDLRMGAWLQGPLFFPMQGDAYLALHPVEHLTLAMTGGIRGRTRSLTLDGVEADDQPKFGVRDLWAMLHEFRGLGYARVGRFLPQFGTKVADHTAYIRRAFGMSQEDPANRVVGAEFGFSANYPYGALSVFGPSTQDAQNPLAMGDGWGTTVSAGVRHMGWQAGWSGQIKHLPLSQGGNIISTSLQWGFNPWFYWDFLPLTYLGEFTAGNAQTPTTGRTYTQMAQYHQLALTLWNGIVVRSRLDWWDPDTEVKDDAIIRPGFGLDLVLFDGLSISGDTRIGIPERGVSHGDFFLQMHGWF